MKSSIDIGDKVILMSVPDWLLQDLPAEEQVEIRGFVGESAIVTDIDPYGYYWVGFGKVADVDGVGIYSGHSLAVPRECISLEK